MISKLVVALLMCVTISHCHMGHEHHDDHNAGTTKDTGVWGTANHVSMKVLQGVDLKWLSKDKEYVTMEMSSFTKGYVSVGFCPKWKGTMEGCDIVIGWVDNANGGAHLYDYFAKGNTLPELDANQDYELLNGTQTNGVTTIRFRRKWNTGDDSYDANLEHNNVRVMWAWHPEDPASPESFLKHAGSSRGHMNNDISFRHPEQNQHHHDHLQSSAYFVSGSIQYLVVTLSLVFFHAFVRK